VPSNDRRALRRRMLGVLVVHLIVPHSGLNWTSGQWLANAFATGRSGPQPTALPVVLAAPLVVLAVPPWYSRGSAAAGHPRWIPAASRPRLDPAAWRRHVWLRPADPFPLNYHGRYFLLSCYFAVSDPLACPRRPGSLSEENCVCSHGHCSAARRSRFGPAGSLVCLFLTRP
jgi:hypothetical protein